VNSQFTVTTFGEHSSKCGTISFCRSTTVREPTSSTNDHLPCTFASKNVPCPFLHMLTQAVTERNAEGEKGQGEIEIDADLASWSNFLYKKENKITTTSTSIKHEWWLGDWFPTSKSEVLPLSSVSKEKEWFTWSNHSDEVNFKDLLNVETFADCLELIKRSQWSKGQF